MSVPSLVAAAIRSAFKQRTAANYMLDRVDALLALEANPVYAKEVTYTETGGGTYTGTVAIPAGATVLNIIVHATALWTAGTSASMEVGDGTDPDGYFTAIDLKATDLLAGQSVDFAKTGGLEGAYLVGTATHWTSRYYAAADTITGTVVSSGAGTAGRTRMTVVYSLPTSTAATKA